MTEFWGVLVGSCLGKRDRGYVIGGSRAVDQIPEPEGAPSPRGAPTLSGQSLEAIVNDPSLKEGAFE